MPSRPRATWIYSPRVPRTPCSSAGPSPTPPPVNLTYEEWEKRYLPLDGIVGKVLNEEHDYSEKDNLRWFLDFKVDHPEKMVLLHYNGTGRRATDEATTRFFAGHFLYYRGTRLTRPLEASASQTVLQVDDTSVFSTERYVKENVAIKDDLVVTRVRDNGKPKWGEAEHLRLRSIDADNGTITVERGAYGTQPLSFDAGSYVAAHVMTGPFTSIAGLPADGLPLWSYNLSTACPWDTLGRNCGDALAEYLAGRLGPGGDLAAFDGITMDVFRFTLVGFPISKVDVNADGTVDGGVVGSADVFSFGSVEFIRKLRERLPDKIILSDGNGPKSQRGFGQLNGIEAEGYFDLYDVELDHLSAAENLFDYWKESAQSPSLNYANFKYKERGSLRDRNTFIEPNLSEDGSYGKLRLALASSLFTDSDFAYGLQEEWMPPEVTWRATGANVRIFDELCKGTEQETHWLGQPLGPPVHLATRRASDPTRVAPELFGGQGETWPRTFIERFRGEGVDFYRVGAETTRRMVAKYTGPYDSQEALKRTWSFALPGIELSRENLFVSLRLRAERLGDYPASVPRRVDVSAAPSGGAAASHNRSFTWAGAESFVASFSFRGIGPGSVDLSFGVEGGRQIYLERMVAYAGGDGRYREYERGVIFANPTSRPYTFDVRRLLPGASLRRLVGSTGQDPVTNDGSAVGERLTLPAKDALFTVKNTG